MLVRAARERRRARTECVRRLVQGQLPLALRLPFSFAAALSLASFFPLRSYVILTLAVRIVPHSVIPLHSLRSAERRCGFRQHFSSVGRPFVRVRCRSESDSNQNGYRRMRESHECVKWHKLREFRQCLAICSIILFRVPFSEGTDN